jgi:tRNA(Ile)-lysidine synthase|tara:strand:- start:13128 stop:14438 length:1311 start_codon:yes stop_codon:yes gene_type:complete
MKSRFLKYITENSLFDKKSKILLALSGGIDSICLADLLVTLNYDVEFAHCNFQLRGIESNQDQHFVKSLSMKYEVPYHTIDFDTKEYALQHKVSHQMAARDQRYVWFEKIRSEISADFIAIAHNSDDNIETFFINIIRGSGIKGLLGIKNKINFIVRPLMFSSRDEIIKYVTNNDLNYREDSSNSSDKYLRNKIRHNLMPLLKEMNPSIGKSISKELSILNNINSVYKETIHKNLNKIIINEDDRIIISKVKLLSLSPLDVYVYEIFSPYGFSDLRNISNTITKGSGKQFFSPTHKLLFDREYIFLSKIIEKETIETSIDSSVISIEIPIKMCFCVTHEVDYNDNINNAYLDFEKLQFPLTIRAWKKGDKFIPLGMSCYKKLSDFFIDIKLSLLDKEKVYLLCSGKDIIWVIGYRIDDRYKVTSKTKKMYIAELFE